MQTHNTIHDIFSKYFNGTSIQKAAYHVSKKLEEGHICLDIDKYNKQEKDSFDLKEIGNSSYVSTDGLNNIQPFVLLNDKLYLHRYFKYETVILDKISELTDEGKKFYKERKSSLEFLTYFISILFQEKFPFKNSNEIPWQLIASLKVVLNNFSIITGGPGTGKTTVITKFLSILYTLNPNTSVALAAPTGKAAARLNESIINTISSNEKLSKEIKEKFYSLKAQTIHRLLEIQYNSPYFNHNKDNLLKYDVVVIDESSMIDAALMAKLLESIGSKSRLIMLGDKNQLASVEAGSIFGDLCKSQENNSIFAKDEIDFFNKFIDSDFKKLNSKFISGSKNIVSGSIIELTKSYRFKNTEGIGKFSSLVIKGNSNIEQLITPFKKCISDKECVKISEDYNSNSFTEKLKIFEDYAKEIDIETALTKLNKIKILCAVREGEYGVKHYNNIVEKYLQAKGLINPQPGFYDKQAIMITANDYMIGLFNGDVGIVREDEESKEKYAYFIVDGNLKKFPIVNINNFETVFAMTIHKSQGSEFDNIVIILPKDSNHKILSRELIYTAVTRAKQNVLVLGSNEVLLKAVKRKIERVSGIKERL